MNSKRNFKNLSPTILETFEELFLNEGGRFNEEAAIIFYKLLNGKSNVMIKSPMSFSDFSTILEEVCSAGDNLLLKRIDEFVEENYALNLDEITEESKRKNKKVNKELQFSDDHARILLKISYLYRFMIPLISVYFTYNKEVFAKPDSEPSSSLDEQDDYEFEEMNSAIFAYLFTKFAADPDALRNKLYKLVFSRVSRTAYSDKRFWAVAKNVSITIESETLEIYKKLLTNVLPKLSIEADRNIVSFFQSVINNQIDFLFQNKFKYKLMPIKDINPNSDDDDEMSEFERLELKQIRSNEGSYIIRKLNIEDVIATIQEKFDVGVDDIEVKEMTAKLKRNSIQEEIVAMLTFKYFKDSKAIKYLNFYQYCFLVIACKKFLEKHKFVYLPEILIADCEKHKDRASISGKKVRPEILASKKYLNLLKNKFKYFPDEIERPFLSFIGTTYSSIFKDKNGNEVFDSSVKVGKIAEELLDAAYLV